jgi:hypothetical protein
MSEERKLYKEGDTVELEFQLYPGPVEFYLKEMGMFYADFWDAGNRHLTTLIEPRRDVESRRWYTASWLTAADDRRVVTAQTHRLLWERVIRQFLQDSRDAERAASAAPVTP